MSEMLNRVAKAIARSVEDRASIEFDRERRPDVMIDHTPFMPDAIAAIEAMRDATPTESMMAAMWSLSYANTRESFSACWIAMIDASLKEPRND